MPPSLPPSSAVYCTTRFCAIYCTLPCVAPRMIPRGANGRRKVGHAVAVCWREKGSECGGAWLAEAVELPRGRDRSGAAARPGAAVDRVGATGGGPDERALRGGRPRRGGLSAHRLRGAAPPPSPATPPARAGPPPSGDG